MIKKIKYNRYNKEEEQQAKIKITKLKKTGYVEIDAIYGLTYNTHILERL